VVVMGRIELPTYGL